MVQLVEIPLEWANNIPGVSGVEDARFQVPEVEDITEGVEETLPDEDDIRNAVADELAGIDPEDLIDVDLSELDLDALGADAVADAILDRLDIEPGLFGPLTDPLDEVIDRAVQEGLEALGELDVDLKALDADELLEIPDLVRDLHDDVRDLEEALDAVESPADALDVPTTDELDDRLTTAVTTAIEDALPDVLTQDLETTAEELVALIEDRLVDDDLLNELRAELEEAE
jgi:hypothetical protein